MYTLYHQDGTRSTAPLLVLEEGGLLYQLRRVDITKDGHRDPAFLAVNPRGMIPALVLEDGRVISETGAIMLYLADHHRLTDLAPLPEEPERGALLDWLFYHVSVVQEAGKRAAFPLRYSSDPGDVSRVREAAVEALVARWKLVDAHLTAHGPYHLGDRFSLIDLYLLFSAAWLEFEDELSVEDLPGVKRCYDLVAARPKCAPVLAAHIEGLHELIGDVDGSLANFGEGVGNSQEAGL